MAFDMRAQKIIRNLSVDAQDRAQQSHPLDTPREIIKLFVIDASGLAMRDLLTQHFHDHLAATQATLESLLDPLEQAIAQCHRAVTQNQRVLACGNGGSAADCQHFVAELVGRFERERRPLPAISLTTDTSILTAVGNDYGFERVFSRQVTALGQRGDVLLGISTSGNSANVVQAIDAAHENGLTVIALTGRDGGHIAGLLREGDVQLCVPHARTMRIQEMHILLLHLICEGVDALILGEKS
jgi:D-sedoheptulose 7-phosphate isomerase